MSRRKPRKRTLLIVPSRAGRGFELVAERALADDPELRLRKLAADLRDRGEQVAVPLLLRKMSDRADHRRVGRRAEFVADVAWIALRRRIRRVRARCRAP